MVAHAFHGNECGAIRIHEGKKSRVNRVHAGNTMTIPSFSAIGFASALRVVAADGYGGSREIPGMEMSIRGIFDIFQSVCIGRFSLEGHKRFFTI